MAGDFNHDGKLDLAVVNTNPPVAILLGNGDGSFSAPTYINVGMSGQSIVAGDFNGDGNLDLAEVTNITTRTGFSAAVGVLLGTGTGTFFTPTFYSYSGSPAHITAGDFNGDGKIDLAVATGATPSALIFTGNGSGGFSTLTVVNLSGGKSPFSVVAADFNNDGAADLAVGDIGNGEIFVLSNNAVSQSVTLNSAHGLPFDVAVGSFGVGELIQGYNNAFDGDGRLLVGGTAFQPSASGYTAADSGQSVVTNSGTVAGLTISRKVTVPNTGNQDFARTLDVFTNSTGSPITTTVTIVGNLGSDAATNVFATSDGSGIVSPNDLWIGTDDASDGSGTPAVIHYIHGSAGLQPTSVNVIGDNITWTYSLTVPAGQTVRLAYFTIVATTRAAAISAANALVTPGGFWRAGRRFPQFHGVGLTRQFLLPAGRHGSTQHPCAANE